MARGVADKAVNGEAGVQNGMRPADGPHRGAAVPAARPGASAPRPKHEAGHYKIRIDRNGAWYHEGGLIGRKELVCLFASVLRREPDGSYWLETPVERGRIEVEDAPFVAVELW